MGKYTMPVVSYQLKSDLCNLLDICKLLNTLATIDTIDTIDNTLFYPIKGIEYGVKVQK